MPSLASMRQLDPGGDSFQPLGPPVREVREVSPPAPKPTGTPGVFEMPDGKLVTNLPDPSAKPAVKVHDSVCGLSDEALDRVCAEIYRQAFDRGEVLRGKRADMTVFDDLQNLQSLTPEQEVMERALMIAVQDEHYPVDGRCWQAHKPGGIPPNSATWVVLRNGQTRNARGICSWGAGSETDKNCHAPAYDVVGWK